MNTRNSCIGLKLENISMEFVLPNGDLVQALHNVEFDMKEGEMLAILGFLVVGRPPCLTLACFLAPTSGTVMLNEQRVLMPGAERGMVFQHGALFEWKTVAENIAFGLLMKGQSAVDSRHNVDGLLDTWACKALVIRRYMSCLVVCNSGWP
ncbi:MAG: taurine transport system ATP-binding protein [Saprospiraceae bacterium]|jgi:taurine transport system ATP-binding protein